VSDLPARATAAGMIVVTPQAVGTPTIWRPAAQGPDPAFLDRILDDLGRTQCIDNARVHIVGFSVGAALAAAYACARPDQIASIVTVTVEAPAGCTQPMPILSFHGTADPVIAYGNYDPTAGPVTGTEANMATWAVTAGCQPTATTTEVGTEVTRLEWPDCTEATEVVLYRILGGGHDWPGKDPATAIVPSTQQVIATDEALEFVARHHM
jgi:polyhydroxybutyrate depolymerase